jgi:hypothetical protein
MILRAGLRLASTTCETEAIVIRAPEGDVDLRCGGAPMAELGSGAPDNGPPVSPFDGGTLIGKRYAASDPAIEILCTKAGKGSLSIGDTPLPPKEAAPLPSSD